MAIPIQTTRIIKMEKVRARIIHNEENELSESVVSDKTLGSACQSDFSTTRVIQKVLLPPSELC